MLFRSIDPAEKFEPLFVAPVIANPAEGVPPEENNENKENEDKKENDGAHQDKKNPTESALKNPEKPTETPQE